jgi:hypothetical protein
MDGVLDCAAIGICLVVISAFCGFYRPSAFEWSEQCRLTRTIACCASLVIGGSVFDREDGTSDSIQFRYRRWCVLRRYTHCKIAQDGQSVHAPFGIEEQKVGWKMQETR